jgi:hypothetical protein
MQIVVQVRSSDRRSRGGSMGAEAVPAALAQVAADLDASVSPLHPGTSDDELSRWYVIEVSDPAAADQLTAQLLELPSVEAAYVKPQDALP